MRQRLIAIAPMMAYTNRHFHYLMRLLTQRTMLYTEMVTTAAILYGRCPKLHFDPVAHPVAIQFGGSDPQALVKCSAMAADLGYGEVNLNIGCPSKRVQNGGFGACLMAQPTQVAQCVAAIADSVNINISVKTRIGIDNQDSYADLSHFIATVSAAGCNSFIIHARKAWLQGLSPRHNRTKPPLKYDTVRQLKQDFPHLEIILNGGIKDLAQASVLQAGVDGVMIGRAAYQNPYLFAAVDQKFYGESRAVKSRHEIITQYMPYVAQQLTTGARLADLLKPVVGLFQGMPGAKAWRTYINESPENKQDGVEVLRQALKLVA